MQKIATRIFIYSSLAFGVLGLIMVFSNTDPGHRNYGWELVVSKLFTASVFIILPSFALSVASKYLNGKN